MARRWRYPGMQSLPLAPPQLLAKPTNSVRERDDASPVGPPADDSFAQRLQQRKPPQKTDQSGADDRETAAPRRASPDAARDAETVASESAAPVPVVATDEPTPLTPALADTLLALIGTTSTALAGIPSAEMTERDPLLAALNALLAGLPAAPTVTVAAPTVIVAAPTNGLEAVPLPLDPSLKKPAHGDLALTAALAAQAALAEGSAGQASVSALSMDTTPVAARPTVGSSQTQPGDGTTATALTSASTSTATALAAQTAATTDDANSEADLPAPPAAFSEALSAVTDDAGDDDASFAAKLQPVGPAAANAKAEAAPVASRAPADAGNPMERVVAQQVSRALIRESADGNRMISLRLTPPELGTVRIDIVERAGVLTARIHAEDAAVRTALERYLPQLRQELQAHNAPVRELQLADAWAGDLTRQQRDHSQNGKSSNRRNASGSRFSVEGTAPLAAAPTHPTSLGGSIAADRVDARA